MNEHEARREEHRQRALAMGLTLPADAVISHESAAIVMGLPTYDVPAAVRVSRTRGRSVRTSDLYVYRVGLGHWDRDFAAGVPVTSMARTAIDLGRHLPFGAALITADAVLRRGVCRDELRARVRDQWTWPMVRRAMPVVRHADPRSETAIESWTRSRFILLGLPMPALQVTIHGASGRAYRPDWSWEEYATVGEADGRVKYTDDALWLEKIRQEDIEDVGREFVRWNWRAAHAPDEEFARRLLRKLERGLRWKQLREGD